MLRQRNTAIWYVSNPLLWPKAPHWMSFSKLSELEVCPRRWALGSADYPHLWDKRGYPRKPKISALEGTVVHLALEKVSQALAKHGCQSMNEDRAFSALKQLGGYTVIISECIHCSLRPYEGNPRATPLLESARQHLISRAPKYRTYIQRLLSRIRLVSLEGAETDVPTHGFEGSMHQLPYGSHAEVEMRVSELSWHGVADLLTLTSNFCEIRDFKTGISKPEHEFQLRLYALLWARDRNLNPSGRLANRLVLSYDESDVEVPVPREGELCCLEDEIRRRTAVVIANLQLDPPDARPSQESCLFCNVRQLCEEYWKWHGQREKCGAFPEGQFADLQVKLAAQHGPTSWDGIVEYSSIINVGQPILLRTSNVPFDLRSGLRVRILNIRVDKSMNEWIINKPTQIVATMGINTEVFVV